MLCPLFWRISVADQAKLMDYQFKMYKYRLQIPPQPDFKIATKLESPEEIGKIITRPPRHQKRVV